MVDKPIFIGGAGSSGSTLLSIMLNRHPEISCGPEMSFFNKKKLYREQYQAVKRNFEKWTKIGLNTDGFWVYPGFLQSRDYYGLEYDQLAHVLQQSKHLKDFTDFIIETCLKNAKKERFAEKTPSNCYCFDEIKRLYPDAKLIHLYRDGRDAFCSFKKKVRHPFFASSLWLYNTVAALSFRDLEGYFELSYEQLVSRPKETLKTLCDHIEVEYSDRMLDPSTEELVDKTRQGEKDWQHRPIDAINSSSVGRYKKDMTEFDRSIFWNTTLSKYARKILITNRLSTRDVLGELGYDMTEIEVDAKAPMRQKYAVIAIFFKRLMQSIKQGHGMIYRYTMLR